MVVKNANNIWCKDMELDTLVAIAIMLLSSAFMVYMNGWQQGLKKVAFLIIVLLVYGGVTYFFGQAGKEILAIVLVVIAFVYLYYKRSKGQSIW